MLFSLLEEISNTSKSEECTEIQIYILFYANTSKQNNLDCIIKIKSTWNFHIP